MTPIQVEIDDQRDIARLASGENQAGPEVPLGQIATLKKGREIFYCEPSVPEDVSEDEDADPPEQQVFRITESGPVTDDWRYLCSALDFSIISPEGEESPSAPYGDVVAIKIEDVIYFAECEGRPGEVRFVKKSAEVDAEGIWADIVGDDDEDDQDEEEEEEEEDDEEL